MRLCKDLSGGRGNTSAFIRDRGGNVAILFGILLLPLLVAVGLAIDGMRALNAAETASNALDAAALAAARELSQRNASDDDLAKVAERFFRANVEGPDKLGYASYSALDVSADRGKEEVTVGVDVTVPTTIGQVAQVDQISFRRESTTAFGISDLDLGLMIDVTGSMSRTGRDGKVKIEALKNAVRAALDIFNPNVGSDKVRIGLAPYSSAVNAGVYADFVSDGQSRDGCVLERARDIDEETLPEPGSFFRSIEQAEKTLRDDRNDPGYDYYDCPDAEVLALTNSRTLIEHTIDRYRPLGRTAGHLGIAWSWYLVSETWRNIWRTDTPPRDYGTKDLIKAVVLMTDGEFNAAYAGSDRWRRAKAESFERASELCKKMNDRGVLVFSVGFDLRERDAIELMESCASEYEDEDGNMKKLFYRAETEAELIADYKDIAIRLTQIRIAR